MPEISPVIRTHPKQRPPEYYDPSQPPLPPCDGWQWTWFPPRPGKWSARRIPSRIPRDRLSPRSSHHSLHYSVFRRLSELLFPWFRHWHYTGYYGEVRKTLGDASISYVTLWRWRVGRSEPPQWACEALARFAEDRGRALIEAAAALRTMPRGPGRGRRKGGAKLNPPREAQERLAREEAERHAMLYPGPIPRPNVPEPPPSTGCRAWIEVQLGRQLD